MLEEKNERETIRSFLTLVQRVNTTKKEKKSVTKGIIVLEERNERETKRSSLTLVKGVKTAKQN